MFISITFIVLSTEPRVFSQVVIGVEVHGEPEEHMLPPEPYDALIEVKGDEVEGLEGAGLYLVANEVIGVGVEEEEYVYGEHEDEPGLVLSDPLLADLQLVHVLCGYEELAPVPEVLRDIYTEGSRLAEESGARIGKIEGEHEAEPRVDVEELLYLVKRGPYLLVHLLLADLGLGGPGEAHEVGAQDLYVVLAAEPRHLDDVSRVSVLQHVVEGVLVPRLCARKYALHAAFFHHP